MMNAELMKFIIQFFGLNKKEHKGKFVLDGELEVEFTIRRLR